MDNYNVSLRRHPMYVAGELLTAGAFMTFMASTVAVVCSLLLATDALPSSFDMVAWAGAVIGTCAIPAPTFYGEHLRRQAARAVRSELQLNARTTTPPGPVAV